MIDFVVIHVYVMLCFALHYSGADITARKQTAKSRKTAKRLKVNLSGGVCHD